MGPRLEFKPLLLPPANSAGNFAPSDPANTSFAEPHLDFFSPSDLAANGPEADVAPLSKKPLGPLNTFFGIANSLGPIAHDLAILATAWKTPEFAPPDVPAEVYSRAVTTYLAAPIDRSVDIVRQADPVLGITTHAIRADATAPIHPVAHSGTQLAPHSNFFGHEIALSFHPRALNIDTDLQASTGNVLHREIEVLAARVLQMPSTTGATHATTAATHTVVGLGENGTPARISITAHYDAQSGQLSFTTSTTGISSAARQALHGVTQRTAQNYSHTTTPAQTEAPEAVQASHAFDASGRVVLEVGDRVVTSGLDRGYIHALGTAQDGRASALVRFHDDATRGEFHFLSELNLDIPVGAQVTLSGQAAPYTVLRANYASGELTLQKGTTAAVETDGEHAAKPITVSTDRVAPLQRNKVAPAPLPPGFEASDPAVQQEREKSAERVNPIEAISGREGGSGDDQGAQQDRDQQYYPDELIDPWENPWGLVKDTIDLSAQHFAALGGTWGRMPALYGAAPIRLRDTARQVVIKDGRHLPISGTPILSVIGNHGVRTTPRQATPVSVWRALEESPSTTIELQAGHPRHGQITAQITTDPNGQPQVAANANGATTLGLIDRTIHLVAIERRNSANDALETIPVLNAHVPLQRGDTLRVAGTRVSVGNP